MQQEKIIIFGIQDSSQLAKFYLDQEPEKYEVIAYCLNQEYITDKEFNGIPVIPFESVADLFSKEIKFFAPLYASQANTVRQSVYENIKKLGFNMLTYINPHACVYTKDIGENVFIGEKCTIQPFTSIGNNTIVWAGNHLGHHSHIKDHCYIAGHVAISGHVTIENNCFLGGNVTIRDKITLKEGSFIVMHSSVMSSTKPWSVYRGDPAKIVENKNSKDVRL